jgi:hypothetical protein
VSDIHLNLLDELEHALHAAAGDTFRVVPSLKENSADVMVAVRDRTAGDTIAATLREHPAVSAVAARPGDQRLHVTFADTRITELGEALERGVPAGMHTTDLAAGRRVIVDFCDPNATKALHIGHLRNIAIGQAITGALRAAGADVQRQTHIGDAGRSMGEAIAGYVQYAQPRTPADTGEKPDHFVGRLYAQYTLSHAPVAEVAEEDKAVARDLDSRKDLAQTLLDGVAAEDPEAVALWKLVRDWAVDGQNQTLARLGVEFERVIFDSDRSRLTAEVVQLGIEQGLFIREPRGTTVYPTGEDSYPYLPLTRADGFPTHHMRTIAMWRDLMHAEEGAELIHPSGNEWRAHAVHVEALLSKMEPGVQVLPTQHVLHGMVSAEVDGELSSSKGTAPLVDGLLDQLADHPHVQALAGETAALSADALSTIALFGFMLDRPVNKGLVLPNVSQIVDDSNIGWKIARAWATACDHAHDGAAQPEADHPDYRHLVLQTQLHRRNLKVALENDNDLVKYVRYLGHLSDWYLSEQRPSNVSRVMRTVLTAGMNALGLLRDVTSTPTAPLTDLETVSG